MSKIFIFEFGELLYFIHKKIPQDSDVYITNTIRFGGKLDAFFSVFEKIPKEILMRSTNRPSISRFSIDQKLNYGEEIRSKTSAKRPGLLGMRKIFLQHDHIGSKIQVCFLRITGF